MYKIPILTTLFINLLIHMAAAQDPVPFVRFPALSPDGSQIAFSYQGDIWVANAQGGEPRRLTIHEAYDQLPKWSPDGSQIAFSSDRYGNDDIFVIPTQGGLPQRITYHSSSDEISEWTKDGQLQMETRRTYVNVERERELSQVSAKGGTPTRLFDAVGFTPKTSPNGRFIAFVRGTCRLAREAYRGPANREIWLYDNQQKSFQQLTQFDGHDFNPVWKDDQTLLFISARNGKFNIFKLALDNNGKAQGSPEALTSYKDFGVRYMEISRDGKKIAFEQFAHIYTMNAEGGNPQKVNLQLNTDYRFDPTERKSYSNNASEYAVSPNGKYLALVIRGEIFVKENDKEKRRTVQLTKSEARDQDIAWLNDSTLLFTSDRNGQYDLFMVRSSNPEQPDLFKSLKHETLQITKTAKDEAQPVISPDFKKIAYTRGGGTLITASISPEGKLSNEKLLLDGWAHPGGVSWSPDARWLAYSLEDLNFNEEVYIHAADNSKKPVNVSLHPRPDFQPVWSKDGSKLGFLSSRNNGDADVWFVWLKKEDWEKTKQDWEDFEEDQPSKKENKGDKKDKKEEELPPIQIDFENIHLRLAQVTGLPGNESSLAISNDGKTFYFVNNRSGRMSYKAKQDLFQIQWDGTEMKPMTSGGQSPFAVNIGPKGSHLYFIRKGGSIGRIKASGGSQESLSFTASIQIDYTAEKKQIFDEGWRTLNKRFYDPEFHGNNWDQLKKKYENWALQASTKRDFREVFNLMLGQLNASHMGMYGPDQAETQQERTGLLGIDIEPLAKGVKIKRVIPNSPADRSQSKLEAGDVILSVNGTEVKAGENFYALLTHTVNERVLLEVEGKDKQKREVIIRPSGSISTLLYEEWVQQRKELTEKYSNGRLGYIHIRGMNWPSFENFERELTASGLGKEGLVIDVRFNGGGWTTDYLMAVLDVRQHAYTIPRGAAKSLDENEKFAKHYPYGERLPFPTWTKPSVAMCNANSYSNAEIFSHAYKTLGLGKLVGVPTFGAVISTGGQGLIDGSYVRVPFRAWYVKKTGKNMENIPAEPDYLIYNTPESKANHRDEQLQKAVNVLLEQIDSEKN
ncbi:S41 family peptidase [Rapidithrix thailandica]|uniref:Tricorn protease homolog n=1 Tax=Rapidithrix thailandica TaxID=413964 RepID=A0AAW9RNC9_9BACT